MKILNVEQIRQADQYTIKNEPITSTDLMERAGRNCYQWILNQLTLPRKVVVFAGPGNNGGDGLVIARLLSAHNLEVQVVVLQFTSRFSDDFSRNLALLEALEHVVITRVQSGSQLFTPDSRALVVDAIFGSGLGRPVEGLAAQAIERINQSGATVVSIDIPSGMFADTPTDESEGAVVHASYTLTLQMPKMAMMMPENEAFTGQMHVVPIGLHPHFLNTVETDHNYIDSMNPIIHGPPRKRFAHKGSYGHVLLMAGSYGKTGACVLAARACLRAGAGLATAFVPKSSYQIVQSAVPECMVETASDKDAIGDLPDLDKYTVLAAGPGLGQEGKTQKMIKNLLQKAMVPLVLDADALNIIAHNTIWMLKIPEGTILTPHPGEFDRLAGHSKSHFERVEKAVQMATQYKLYIVLKGAHTAICTPEGKVWFNSTGNPGMATGGSGDVLTGIIAGLLAQGYSRLSAACRGVFLHGLAGDLAAKENGMEAMLASHIIQKLSEAFSYNVCTKSL